MSVAPPNFLTCPAVPELMPPQEEAILTSPKKKKHTVRWIVLILLVLLLIALAPLAYGGMIAYRAAEDLQTTVKAAQNDALAYDFTAAQTDIAKAQADLASLKSGLDALGAWKFAPVIGPQIAAFVDAERAGESTLAGVQGLVGVAQTIDDAFKSTSAIASRRQSSITGHPGGSHD